MMVRTRVLEAWSWLHSAGALAPALPSCTARPHQGRLVGVALNEQESLVPRPSQLTCALTNSRLPTEQKPRYCCAQLSQVLGSGSLQFYYKASRKKVEMTGLNILMLNQDKLCFLCLGSLKLLVAPLTNPRGFVV